MPSTCAQFLDIVKQKGKKPFALLGKGTQWKFYLDAEVNAAVKLHQANAENPQTLVTGLGRFGANKHTFLVDGDKVEAKTALKGAFAAEKVRWDDTKFEIKDETDDAPAAPAAAPAPKPFELPAGIKQVSPNLPSKPSPGRIEPPAAVKAAAPARPRANPHVRFKQRLELLMPELNLANAVDPEVQKKAKAALALAGKDAIKANAMLDEVEKALFEIGQKDEVIRLGSQARMDWSKLPKPVTDASLLASHSTAMDRLRQRDAKGAQAAVLKLQDDIQTHTERHAVIREVLHAHKGVNSLETWLASDSNQAKRQQIAGRLKLPEQRVVAHCQAMSAQMQDQAQKLRPKGFAIKPPTPEGLCTINPLIADAARPKLTLAEANAAQDYTRALGPDPAKGGELTEACAPYALMNNALRRKPPQPIAPPHDETFKQLRQAFAKTKPLPQPLPTSRGMNFKNPVDLMRFVKQFQDNLGKNELIPLKGFVSAGTTGVQPNMTGNVEFHIVVKQGLDMLPYSETPQEREILLNHDTLVKTVSVTQNGTKWIIKVEQILAKAP